MKLQENYTVCEIAGETFVMPVGAEIINMRAMLSLNETSAFIVNELKNRELTKEEMVDLIEAEFEADRTRISKDIDVFLDRARQIGFIVD